jgi:tetratricopeptide (TPR) repeat protein
VGLAKPRSRRSIAGAALALLVLAAQPSGSMADDLSDSLFSDFVMKRENLQICFDQKQPPSKRLSSCTQILDKENLQKNEYRMVYVARAQIYRKSGDDRAALQDLNAAVKIDPKSGQAWVARGTYYLSKTDYSAAMEDFNTAVKLSPKDPVGYDNRGIGFISMGKPEAAIADFTRAIALDPHDMSAYSNRATAGLATGKLEQVIADLTEVIRVEAANGMAYYNRGTAYDREGKTDQALDDYRITVRLLPSFAPAFAALGRLLKDKDPDAAVSEMTEAIRLDPRSPALRSRATLYLSMGRLDQALVDFNQAIANNGSDAIAYLDRGVAKEKLGRLQDAIRDYSRSFELSPSIAVQVNRGNAYALLQQPDQALADFNAALATEPRNLLALLGKANAHYAQKRRVESLEDYTRVIQVDPNNVIAYFKRGNVHLDLQEFAAAFSDYSASLRLDPNQAVALYNRAIANGRLGRRKEAADDRRRALALDPELANGELLSRGK